MILTDERDSLVVIVLQKHATVIVKTRPMSKRQKQKTFFQLTTNKKTLDINIDVTVRKCLKILMFMLYLT